MVAHREEILRIPEGHHGVGWDQIWVSSCVTLFSDKD
jgi:hypothetical protein